MLKKLLFKIFLLIFDEGKYFKVYFLIAVKKGINLKINLFLILFLLFLLALLQN
jgi:hypothetical protein